MQPPLISDPVIHAVPIKDCLEPMVSLHNDPDIVIGSLYAELNPQLDLLREGVAERLRAAQQALPPGLRLVLEEGCRPIALQRQLFEDYQQKLAEQFPDWNPTRLHREVTRFIADPEGTPPHSSGGAVDIWVMAADGQALDMGSGFDEPAHLCENRSYTHADNISAEAKANRQILIDAMSSAGFVNYFTEWWHWSYGDQYWGYLSGHTAIYGRACDLASRS